MESTIIKARKGSNQVQFSISISPPEGNPEYILSGLLTVNEDKADEVRNAKPLMVRYLSSRPADLRLPDEKSQAWVAILGGIVMSFVAYLSVKRWKAGKYDPPPDDDEEEEENP